jgi:hypothetical protein
MLGEKIADLGITGGPFVYGSGFWVSPNLFWVSLGLSIIFLILCLYLGYQIYLGKQKDSINYKNHFISPSPRKRRNKDWEKVKELLLSKNPTDWRMGIMEADNLLDSLLTMLGYEGESLGAKLKSIEASDFPTLQYAWEAHKIRNKIAHEGMNYQLDASEVGRVLRLYETVFEDARFI